jgi:hypothetical protein
MQLGRLAPWSLTEIYDLQRFSKRFAAALLYKCITPIRKGYAMNLYSMPEVVTLLGQTYNRVYYATATGKVKPRKAGRARLFDDRDVERLRQYFKNRGQRVDALRVDMGPELAEAVKWGLAGKAPPPAVDLDAAVHRICRPVE